MKVLACLLTWCFAVPLCAAEPVMRFDDSAADRMRLVTDTYELQLSKANGAIVAIHDRNADVALTLGSRNACLWGTTYAGASVYRGGCNYAAGRADSFSYEWQESAATLRLDYNPAAEAAQRVAATVVIEFQPNSFAMKLAVENAMGVTLQTVLFPSDLIFEDKAVEGAYVPYYLPGVRLKPGFFAENRSVSVVYPSARAFADYLALDVQGGRLALYGVHSGDAVLGATLGFQDDERTRAGTFYAFHNFQTWVPNGGRFETPWVRFCIGQTAQETIGRYRLENGIADYPGVADKLGDWFAAVAMAPLIKMDLRQIGHGFAQLIPRLESIRAPAILHPVSYWPRGFDQNYPDFLPPDSRFGSNSDFRAFVDAAHARGFFVMPYTNPTWWDDQSPTARAVPDITEFAALDQEGKPRYESYGTNRGFVSSPHAPGVRARLAELMAQWRDEVPVDFVLQDQIGSRSWIRDFHPAAPDPLRYYDAWLELTRIFAGQKLMTEDGWDRLAATEIGFAGSALTGATTWNPASTRWGAGSRANTAFGVGRWEPYPLAVWLFHDKVLFFHHDLDDRPMNAGAEVLTWNAAFGVMAGYFWPEMRISAPDWPAIAAAFQPAVLARTAGRMLGSFRQLAPEVTESRYDDLAVIANWNAGASYEVSGETIAPSGCLIRSDDGAIVAGVLIDRFNGEALSPGVHYLVVETSGDAIAVRQPSGSDTPITIALPSGWDLSGGVEVQALSVDGRVLTSAVPLSIEEGHVRFVWTRPGGVDRFEIRPANRAQ